MFVLSVGYTNSLTWDIFYEKPKSCYVPKKVLDMLSEINLKDTTDKKVNRKYFVNIEKTSGMEKDGSGSAFLVFLFVVYGSFLSHAKFRCI